MSNSNLRDFMVTNQIASAIYHVMSNQYFVKHKIPKYMNALQEQENEKSIINVLKCGSHPQYQILAKLANQGTKFVDFRIWL